MSGEPTVEGLDRMAAASGSVRQAEELFDGILPSGGVPWAYGDKHPGGKFQVREMGTNEEALIAGARDKRSVIDQLIKNLVVNEVPWEEYLVADKFYMLFFIRATSLTPDYGFTLKCPKCGQEFLHNLTLPDDLMKKQLEPDDPPLWPCDLPRLGKTIELRYLRNKDEAAIERFLGNEYSRSVHAGDPSYQYRMAMWISTIDGQEASLQQRLSLVRQMKAKDSAALRAVREKMEIGVDLRVNTECPRPRCAEKIDTMIKFDQQFFRPDPSSL